MTDFSKRARALSERMTVWASEEAIAIGGDDVRVRSFVRVIFLSFRRRTAEARPSLSWPPVPFVKSVQPRQTLKRTVYMQDYSTVLHRLRLKGSRELNREMFCQNSSSNPVQVRRLSPSGKVIASAS